MAKLQCVVVTPEKTEIDREVDAVVLPMYDGEMGVLANRAPVIGRLGYGTLTMTSGSSKEKFFIDGGFVQIENNVISVLTARAFPVSQIDATEAQRALEESLEMPAGSEEQRLLRDAAILRARGQIRSVH